MRGPATSWAEYPDTAEHGGELRAIPTLPGGDQQGQGRAAVLAPQVRLRSPATPGAAEPVIRRLGTADATGWFLRPIPFARPGRALVRRARVETTPTSHQPGRVRQDP